MWVIRLIRSFILEQADRDIRWLPDSAGICIDRTDWFWNNTDADDGVSWVNGKAGAFAVHFVEQSAGQGWARRCTPAGKVIFVNPIYSRFDVLPPDRWRSTRIRIRRPRAEHHRADGHAEAGDGVDLQRDASGPIPTRFSSAICIWAPIRPRPIRGTTIASSRKRPPSSFTSTTARCWTPCAARNGCSSRTASRASRPA